MKVTRNEMSEKIRKLFDCDLGREIVELWKDQLVTERFFDQDVERSSSMGMYFLGHTDKLREFILRASAPAPDPVAELEEVKGESPTRMGEAALVLSKAISIFERSAHCKGTLAMDRDKKKVVEPWADEAEAFSLAGVLLAAARSLDSSCELARKYCLAAIRLSYKTARNLDDWNDAYGRHHLDVTGTLHYALELSQGKGPRTEEMMPSHRKES